MATASAECDELLPLKKATLECDYRLNTINVTWSLSFPAFNFISQLSCAVKTSFESVHESAALASTFEGEEDEHVLSFDSTAGWALRLSEMTEDYRRSPFRVDLILSPPLQLGHNHETSGAEERGLTLLMKGQCR